MAIAIDPVCGMDVETEGADLTADHDGVTYYFCGRGCLLDFRDEPDRYVSQAAGVAGEAEGTMADAGPGLDAAAGGPSTSAPDPAR